MEWFRKMNGSSLESPSNLNWGNVREAYTVLKNILAVAKSVITEDNLFANFALVKVLLIEQKIKQWDSASKSITVRYQETFAHLSKKTLKCNDIYVVTLLLESA